MHATGSVHSFDLKSFIDFDIGRFFKHANISEIN